MPAKADKAEKATNDEVLKELKNITEKLTTIAEKLDEIHIFVREQNEEEQRDISSEVSRHIKLLCNNVETLVTTRPEERIGTHEKVIENTSRSVIAIKSRMGHSWNKNYIARKFAYWNMIKNHNKAEIYEKWINSTPIILPRKLQIKPIREEPEQQRRLRERMSLDKMNMEIELLRLRSSANEERYKDIDVQMEREIKEKADGILCENVMKLWKEECEKEELISLQRWIKSENWFYNYEEQFKKEYTSDNPFLKGETFYSEFKTFDVL